jgi:hypothetical protein
MKNYQLKTTIGLIILSVAFLTTFAQNNFKGLKAVTYSGNATSSAFVGSADAEFEIDSIDKIGNVKGTITLSGNTTLVWNVKGKIDQNGVLRLSGQNDFRLDFTGRVSGNTINGDFTLTAKDGKRSGKMTLVSGSSDYSANNSDDDNSGNSNSNSEQNFSTEGDVPNCPSGVFEGVSTGVYRGKKISVRLEFTRYTSVGNNEMNLTYSGGVERSGSVFGDWETSSRMRVTGNIGGLPTSMQLNFAGNKINGRFMVPINTQPVYGNFTVACVGGGSIKNRGNSSNSDSSDDDDDTPRTSGNSSNYSTINSDSYSTDFDTSADFEPCESGEYRGNGIVIRVTDYRTIENSEITIDLTNKYGGNGTFNGTWQGKPKMLMTGYLGGRPTRMNVTFAGKKVSGNYSIAHANGPTTGNFVASCSQ